MRRVARWVSLFILVAIVAVPGARGVGPGPHAGPHSGGSQGGRHARSAADAGRAEGSHPASLLKDADKGKTLRIMFQGGGDSAPAVEMKDFFKEHDRHRDRDRRHPARKPAREAAGGLHRRQRATTTSWSCTRPGSASTPRPATSTTSIRCTRSTPARSTSMTSSTGAQVGFDKYQGSWYAIPYDGDVNIFYYRKDLWEDPKEQAAFKAKYGYDLKAAGDLGAGAGHGRVLQPADQKLNGFGTLALRTWWAADYWANVYRPMMPPKCTERPGQRQERVRAGEGRLHQGQRPVHGADEVLAGRYPELGLPGEQGRPGQRHRGHVACSGPPACSATRASRPTGTSWASRRCRARSRPTARIKRKPALAVGKALVMPADARTRTWPSCYGQFLASKAMQIYETNTGSGVDPNRTSVYADQRVKDVWDGITDAAHGQPRPRRVRTSRCPAQPSTTRRSSASCTPRGPASRRPSRPTTRS